MTRLEAFVELKFISRAFRFKVSRFELFELVPLLNSDKHFPVEKQFPVEQSEAAVSNRQSGVQESCFFRSQCLNFLETEPWDPNNSFVWPPNPGGEIVLAGFLLSGVGVVKITLPAHLKGQV